MATLTEQFPAIRGKGPRRVHRNCLWEIALALDDGEPGRYVDLVDQSPRSVANHVIAELKELRTLRTRMNKYKAACRKLGGGH